MVTGFQMMIVFGQFVASVLGGVFSMSWADPKHWGWRLELFQLTVKQVGIYSALPPFRPPSNSSPSFFCPKVLAGSSSTTEKRMQKK
jgi:hypothetical protein